MVLNRVKSVKSLLSLKGLREIVFQPFHSHAVSLLQVKWSGVRVKSMKSLLGLKGLMAREVAIYSICFSN